MSNILVFDASSEWCSAALAVGNERFSAAEQQPRKHAQLLLPMIESLLKDGGISPAELDGIAFGKGPGSFTGLRIAMAVAQGLCLGSSAKALGISSLQALALQAIKAAGESRICAVMNAHMGEVFCAAYENHGNLPVAVTEESLVAPESVHEVLPESDGSWIGAGDGFSFSDTMSGSFVSGLKSVHQDLFPLAESMMDIALDSWADNKFTDIDRIEPVYLRDTVAWKKLSEQPSLLNK